ncbi:c-type cytochrome [uncultured Roseovarius sp.]|uniref:c-type cytochrome n=1 Tax=uncultured Roseovarius sp. TaxID=293344 RepID=UPI0025FCF762|nr:c-type cytochrome [uncultured Roseovarius sp.]
MRYLGLSVIFALAGCVSETGEAPGEEIYSSYCVACHGKSAQGDGPLASDLPVAPADLTVLAARNDGVFPYSDVMAQIYGYPGQFHVMPEFGPLLEGPHVMWRDETGAVVETPRALLDLARYLETLQRG